MYLVNFSSSQELKQMMLEAGVDLYGIKIMLPKASSLVLRINDLACIKANILKQEMLSLSGDAAVSRQSLTGKIKKTDCFLMGNLSQYQRLSEKLAHQPLGLSKIGEEIQELIQNSEVDNFDLRFGNYKLKVTPEKCFIVGIVNLTPDSFSSDGFYNQPKKALIYAKKLIRDGADIIDLGGESTRPGAKPVSLKDELARVIPVIKSLAKNINVPISIDTYKPQVAKVALDLGASIINNITGLKALEMRKVVCRYKAGAVIMHSKGKPKSMQKNPKYNCLIEEIYGYLNKSIEQSLQSGIKAEQLLIDPGIGFGKTFEHNLEILKNLSAFKALRHPILIGPSRKSFIGKINNVGTEECLSGTIAASVFARLKGASFLRVHDVLEVKKAIQVIQAINLENTRLKR